MNKSPDLRTASCFALVADLKKTVADFARREQKLTRDIGTRRSSTLRQQTEAEEAVSNWLTNEVDQTNAQAEENLNRVRSIAERRRVKIQRLYRSRSVNLAKQGAEVRDRWIGDLQLRHFNAGKKLAAEQKRAEKEYAEFSQKMSEWNSALQHLEHKTRFALSGYGSFRKLLLQSEPEEESLFHVEYYKKFETGFSDTQDHLVSFRRLLLPRFFAAFPLFVLLPLVLLGGGISAFFFGAGSSLFLMLAGGSALLAVVLLALFATGKKQGEVEARALASSMISTKNAYHACLKTAETEHATRLKNLQEAYDLEYAEITEKWERADEVEQEFLQRIRGKIESQFPRMLEQNERMLAPRLAKIQVERDRRILSFQNEAETRRNLGVTKHERALIALDEEEVTRWTELERAWQREITPLYEAITAMNELTDRVSPPWTKEFVETWLPPTLFPEATRYGRLHVDLRKDPGQIPHDPRLALPGPTELEVPLTLTFPGQGSMLFETADSANPTVIGCFNNVILRLLSTTPPGKVSFTIIDPVGLGENFAGLMHLSDYEESLINRRIWTQSAQIDERLAELNEHLEKVIQMYLRNEYATITEYNAQAGSVAEKYHFLVVADFPSGFSDTAAKRLLSVAASGARCGVFTLVHWDRRGPLPDGFAIEELRKHSVGIRKDRNGWIFSPTNEEPKDSLSFDTPPESELAVELVRRIGTQSIDSNRVEVPFSQITPAPEAFWQNETTQELRIPIGRTGATKLQYLAIGKGTRQHALFAGKTGSGKSTLFHVIITNLALSCSPEQVEFYLIDFKKGVEFKCYAEKRLPHARVVAIESDREFALSVLQRVDEELKRRGDLFRKLGVQDVAGYKRAGGSEPMPRSLLLIDEFQEFFVEDDQIGQTASLLFDRIVRQGRAFGIHVILGSQTLGGAYTLARATLGQMVIRVALQCNEADAYLIMDDNNPAPRLLTRPGEGIYNDAAGAMEGNSPFQVVWLPDDERDRWLDKVVALAEQHPTEFHGPIVFEGNAPANIRENRLLTSALSGKPLKQGYRAWLGAPNAIKGPTEALFEAQSGSHLLIVGQREEAVSTMLNVCLASLASGPAAARAKFIWIQSGSPEEERPRLVDLLSAAVPERVNRVLSHQVPEAIQRLGEELKLRVAGDSAVHDPVFVFVHEMQKFKKLRYEDEFDFGGGDSAPSASSQFNSLITEGAAHGIHLLLTLDTYNNVSRFLSRKALTEFEMRVVFQMSANDSSSLIDSTAASNLGLHRALYYNEREGRTETFRPYAALDEEWVCKTAENLGRLLNPTVVSAG